MQVVELVNVSSYHESTSPFSSISHDGIVYHSCIALAIAFYKAGAHVILSGRNEATLKAVILNDLLPLSASMVATGPPTPSIVVFDMAAVAQDEVLATSIVQQAARCSPVRRVFCRYICC